jgi:UrcA family protein
MIIVASLLAAASAAVVSVPAEAHDMSTARVVTRDLDLTSERGQRALNLRVARAATAVCSGVNARFDVTVRVAQRQCRDAAIARALTSKAVAMRLAAR